jgi:hypothetical protein
MIVMHVGKLFNIVNIQYKLLLHLAIIELINVNKPLKSRS